MRKTIICSLTALLVLAGCGTPAANNQEKPEAQTVFETEDVMSDAYAEIPTDKILTADIEADFAIDPDDTKACAEQAKAVVIGKVLSIDGGSTWSDKKDSNVQAFTYGKFKVIKSLRGDLSEGETYLYTRDGGIVTWEDWLKSRPENAQEKLKSIAGDNLPEYVQDKYDFDIDVEAGKTYLMFLDDEYSPMKDAYAVIYYRVGLREVKEMKDDLDQVEVLNPITNEYELLKTIPIQ